MQQEVLEAMMPFFTSQFGNPSSHSHPYGWQAREAIELSKSVVQQLLRNNEGEMVFTSGATEGLNFLIRNFARKLSRKGRHILSVRTEHPACRDSVLSLRPEGFEVEWLNVKENGTISLDELRSQIRPDTILVSVMAVNNETGVIHPVEEIGKICREKDIFFISDFTQAIGKLPFPLPVDTVDGIVFSAHKFYGPKGIGVAWFSNRWKKWKPDPVFYGGGHQDGLRSGTLPVPLIVGLSAALEHRMKNNAVELNHLTLLKKQFQHLISDVPEVYINCAGADCVPSVVNFRARFVDAQAVLSEIRSKLAISTGSACSSANPEPSPVLLAMGLTASEAKSSFRISFGVPTTSDEVAEAGALLIKAIASNRTKNPTWQMFKQGIDLEGYET